MCESNSASEAEGVKRKAATSFFEEIINAGEIYLMLKLPELEITEGWKCMRGVYCTCFSCSFFSLSNLL